MKLAVTGATGYIGQRLVALARSEGHEVLALTRPGPSRPSLAWMPFDLSQPRCPELPCDIDVLVHLAAHVGPSREAPDELRAALALMTAAKASGARFVFLSSQAARPDAPTAYGRSKWQIERAVEEAGGWIIRPGLVFGGPSAGLWGRIVWLVGRLPVLPALFPPAYVQPVHVDDLAAIVLRGALLCDGITRVGAPEPVSFSRFLRLVARDRVRRWRPRFPVPAIGIVWLHRILGPTRSERTGISRLVSLIKLEPMETWDDLSKLGFSLRPLDSALRSKRRILLVEARGLLRYVLRDDPPITLLRRYVRYVERVHGGTPLILPHVTTLSPFALRVYEHAHARIDQHDGSVRSRIDAAMAIAEASTAGSVRFIAALEHRRPFASVFWIIRALVTDVTARGLALLARPWINVPAQPEAMKQ